MDIMASFTRRNFNERDYFLSADYDAIDPTSNKKKINIIISLTPPSLHLYIKYLTILQFVSALCKNHCVN